MSTQQHSCHDLDLQQRINRGLLDLVSSILIGIEALAQLKHKIFLALSYKCFTTAKAIRSLCDQNLHDDAFALLRVLVEGMINAVYVLESDDQTANDYMDYPKFRAWHQFDQIRQVSPPLADFVSQADQKQMEAEFQQVKSRYEKNPGKDWSKDNIFNRAKFIDAQDQHSLFKVLMNVTWQEAGGYVHSTAQSIEWRISGPDIASSGVPSKEEIATLLYYANMALFTLVALLDKQAGNKGITRWKELYDDWKKP